MSNPSNEVEYEIQLTPLALEMLSAVKNRREQEKLRDRIDQLKVEPEKQGKALVDNLSGFRSVRAVGQRYRIVYKIE
jgi:mRNA interferase RelE/StbE